MVDALWAAPVFELGVLREEARRRPDQVVAWLSTRTHRVSGVTLREPVRHLAPDDRLTLMTAYQAGRRGS